MEVDFQGLLEGLYDIWSFCWVPLAAVSLVIFVIRFVYVPSREWANRVLQAAKEKATGVAQAKDSLAAVGLSKIIPVLTFAIVVFGFMMVNEVVEVWVPVLPPHLEISTMAASISRLDNHAKALFLRAFPSTEHVPEELMTYRGAYSEALHQARVNGLLATRWVPPESYLGYQLIKAAFIAALLSLLYAIIRWRSPFRTLGRFLLVTIALAVVWSGVSMNYLFIAGRQASHDTAAAKQVVGEILGSEGFGPPTDEELERIAEEDDRFAPRSAADGEGEDKEAPRFRWWRVTALSPQLRAWLMAAETEYRHWRWPGGIFH